MPELPEVETMRRGILAAKGGRVVRIFAPEIPYRPIKMEPVCAQIDRRLRGRFITDVRRLGKRVIIDFDGKFHLLLQPKMAGLVAIEEVPGEQYTRLVIQIDGSAISQIKYWDRRGLGVVSLLDTAALSQYIVKCKLGPDALEVSMDSFIETFIRLKKEVKPALLDQAKVAGIGNLYASEILHLAQIVPFAKCNDLTSGQWGNIWQRMREVLLTAIEFEGSTLSDGTYRNALNKSGGYQNAHRVYDRAELACLTCRNSHIVRIVQAQRSTFYCPACQPKGKPSHGRRKPR